MTPPLHALVPVAGLLVFLLAGGSAPAGAGRVDTDPVGVWPLRPQPEVVDGFDPPDTPYGRGHRGVDLAGRPGQTVRSALPGTVSWTGRLAGVGIVVVDHGPTRTTYQPVRDPPPRGTSVAAGGRIGVLDLAGSHCFPRACLHWGWLRGEVYLDPLELVGLRPVRLLPLLAGSASTRSLPVTWSNPYDAWRPWASWPTPGTGPSG